MSGDPNGILNAPAKPLNLRIFYQANFGQGWLEIRESEQGDDMLEVQVGERRGNTTLRQGCMIDPEDALRIGNALTQWANKPRILLGDAKLKVQ